MSSPHSSPAGQGLFNGPEERDYDDGKNSTPEGISANQESERQSLIVTLHLAPNVLQAVHNLFERSVRHEDEPEQSDDGNAFVFVENNQFGGNLSDNDNVFDESNQLGGNSPDDNNVFSERNQLRSNLSDDDDVFYESNQLGGNRSNDDNVLNESGQLDRSGDSLSDGDSNEERISAGQEEYDLDSGYGEIYDNSTKQIFYDSEDEFSVEAHAEDAISSTEHEEDQNAEHSSTVGISDDNKSTPAASRLVQDYLNASDNSLSQDLIFTALDSDPQVLADYLNVTRELHLEILDNDPTVVHNYLRKKVGRHLQILEANPTVVEAYFEKHKYDHVMKIMEKHPLIVESFLNSHRHAFDDYMSTRSPMFYRILEDDPSWIYDTIRRKPQILKDYLQLCQDMGIIGQGGLVPDFVKEHLNDNPTVLHDYLGADTPVFAQVLDRHQDRVVDYFANRPDTHQQVLNTNPQTMIQDLDKRQEVVEKYLESHSTFLDKFLESHPAFIATYIQNNVLPSLAVPPSSATKANRQPAESQTTPPSQSLKERSVESLITSTDIGQSAPITHPSSSKSHVPQTTLERELRKAAAKRVSQNTASLAPASAQNYASSANSRPLPDSGRRFDLGNYSRMVYQSFLRQQQIECAKQEGSNAKDQERAPAATHDVGSVMGSKQTSPHFPKDEVLITSVYGQKKGELMPYPAPVGFIKASMNQPKDSKNSWRLFEEERAIKLMLDVRDEGVISGEDRFREVALRLCAEGFDRTWVSVKNFWNRVGRARSGFDERKNKTAPLATSKQGKLAKLENQMKCTAKATEKGDSSTKKSGSGQKTKKLKRKRKNRKANDEDDEDQDEDNYSVHSEVEVTPTPSGGGKQSAQAYVDDDYDDEAYDDEALARAKSYGVRPRAKKSKLE